MSNNKKSFVLPFLFLIITIFMGIGYAALNSVTLDIKGTIATELQDGVYITSVRVIDSNDADLTETKVNVTYQTLLSTTLKLNNNPNSYVTYQVTIYNSTPDVYAYTDNTVNAGNYDNNNIGYEIIGLSHGDVIESKSSKTFQVKFKYVDGLNINNTILNSYIKFNFDIPHTITYDGVKNSEILPKYILDGDTLNLDLSNNDVISLAVRMNGSILSSSQYTYNNRNLIINNVTGDIVIYTIDLSGYEFLFDGSSTSISFAGINPDNPLIIRNLFDYDFDGINLSGKKVKNIVVTFTYNNGTGSKQDTKCSIITPTKTYTETIKFMGNVTGATLSATFNDVNLDVGTEFQIDNGEVKLTNGSIYITDMTVQIYFE